MSYEKYDLENNEAKGFAKILGKVLGVKVRTEDDNLERNLFLIHGTREKNKGEF